MQKYIKRILCVVLLVCLSLGGLHILSTVTERKDSRAKYAAFFEATQDLDVLYLGTSHVLNAFFPMELWKDFGVTSYNLAGHSSTMALNYWVLMNALEYTSPRLVIIDCYGACLEEKCTSVDYVHLSLDAFPLTRTKLAAINDLFDADSGRRFDFIWDFSVYHSRWKELTSEDFKTPTSPEKGADSRVGVAVPAVSAPSAKVLDVLPDNTGISYLRRIAEECRARGIDVLLTYLPFPAGEHEWMEANYISGFAAAHGLDYINFLGTDVVSFDTDCYDAASHLNPSGARKTTRYLGEYIRANYGLPDRRGDEAYSSWNADYSAYLALKRGLLTGQNELAVWLMLLSGADIDSFVCIPAGSPALADERIQKLITNLDPSGSGGELDAAGGLLAVCEGGALRLYDMAEFSRGIPAAAGRLQLITQGDGGRITLDGESIFEFSGAFPDAAVAFDAGSGSVCAKSFSAAGNGTYVISD